MLAQTEETQNMAEEAVGIGKTLALVVPVAVRFMVEQVAELEGK
jgi:hypothetical protein